MSVSHLLKLVMHWTGYGEEGTLSWYFQGNAADHTPDELHDAAGNVIHLWETNETPAAKTDFLQILMPPQKVDLVTLYEYSAAPGPATALGSAVPNNWVGSGATMAGPLQTCLVASLRTAHAGASYRGRQYFPGSLFAAQQSNALVTNARADQIRDLAGKLAGDASQAIAQSLSINTLEWCVYSPTKGITTAINGISVDNKLDTQRRREAQLASTYVSTAVYGS